MPTAITASDNTTPAPGTVTLVGAGPGDPDLMTVAGRAALLAATYVYYDRLGPSDQVAQWAPQAELVDVGKLPGFHRVPQTEINRLIVESARQGETVVRLKGGDPFVFGRGFEEVTACHQAGIPVRVIPGITSAIAAPAAANIPVTFRELSQHVTIATGHDPFTAKQCTAFAALVNHGGTLVILMGMQRLAGHLQDLQQYGVAPQTPAAVVMNGTTEQQREAVSTVSQLPAVVAAEGLTSPSVIVIGKVANLPESLARIPR